MTPICGVEKLSFTEGKTIKGNIGIWQGQKWILLWLSGYSYSFYTALHRSEGSARAQGEHHFVGRCP